MKINFMGAARTVTGSCYLLEHGQSRFLVDCGLFQGNKATKQRNYEPFLFEPQSIDFVLLTHAHIDHSGLLPKLYKHGFAGTIYTTTVSVALCEIMLPDSAYIQEGDVERKNRKLSRAGKPLIEPIYTVEDAQACQKLFKGIEYNTEFSPAPGIRVVLRDAGHIFGSAMIEIYYQEDGQERKIVFTGDLGRNDQAIVRDPYLMKDADYLIMESTYGNRLHEGNMEEEMPKFVDIVNRTLARNGNVIIPAFAVDRTQDILYMLNEMQNLKLIPIVPVYVDSPLAIRATEVFAGHPKYYDRLTAKLFNETGHPPFVLDNLTYARTVAESQRLNLVKRSIIISASGMADAGRIKHHLKHNLWRENCSVVFFGYQAEGTLGRRLVEGEKKVIIHGEEIEVKAEVHNLDGFSAHADRNELLAWLAAFERMPQQIFVTHGEESASLSFAELLRETYPQVAVDVPHIGDYFELTATRVVAHENIDFRNVIVEEKVLVDINTMLQEIALSQDAEKLMRVRDFLKQIS